MAQPVLARDDQSGAATPVSPAPQAPHLLSYLGAATASGLPEPAFHQRLPRELRRERTPNLLYPVGNGVYVHIYTVKDHAPRYRLVEPDFDHDLAALLSVVERRIVESAADLAVLDGAADPVAQLLHAISACCTAKRPTVWQRLLALGRRAPLVMAEAALTALKYRLVRDKAGTGLLQPFLQDPYLEDIGCSGVGPIYVVHKLFGSLESDTGFASAEALDSFVVFLAEKIGRQLTLREPILDAALPDGSRINIVFGRQVARRGSNFTVRRVPEQPLSLLDLVHFGTLNAEMLAYLSLLIGEGLNLFIAGEAASGKTTLMNALTTFFPPESRLVSIEDTPELRLAHGNWIAEVAQPDREGSGRVTLFELVKSALRQRPTAILIGEIRGEEGPVAFQAMQTGHACLSTIHAANVGNVLQRLTNHPIEVPRENLESLHAIVILGDVRLPGGRRGRRVVSITEQFGYDGETGRFQTQEVFRWIPSEDRFEFLRSSRHLQERVAHRRGLPQDRTQAIYEELQRRARHLQRLDSSGVSDYDGFYQHLAQAHRRGLFG